MTDQQLLDVSEAALAAYGKFVSEGVLVAGDLITLNGDIAGFSESQAKKFTERFLVNTPTFNDGNNLVGSGLTSFDVSVFHGRANDNIDQIVIAIRGTQQKFETPSDLQANLEILSLHGAATQIVAMVNWWYRVSSTKNAKVPQFRIIEHVFGDTLPVGAVQLSFKSTVVGHEVDFTAGDYLVRVADAVSNGSMVDALGRSTSVTVTGSSMGGHLAMAFAGIFGDSITQAVAFNAPGFPDNRYVRNLFYGLGGKIPRVNDPKIVNVVSSEEPEPGDSLNITAGFPFGNFPGRRLNIPIEDQAFSDVPDPKKTSGNHDQRQVTDSLTVFRLFQQLDVTLTLDRFGTLMRQSASGENRSLENLVDSLERLLHINNTQLLAGNAYRSELHAAVQGIAGELPQQASPDPHFASIAGHVSVRPVARDLVASARKDFGALVALQELSAFYLCADERLITSAQLLADFWQSTRTNDYSIWLGERNSPNPVALSKYWLQDRATFLESLSSRNARNLSIELSLFGSSNLDMLDVETHQKIAFRHGGPVFGFDVGKVIFGNSEINHIVGDAWADRLYGAAGDDHLEGFAGDDYLEGGRGIDTYVFNNQFGRDDVVDLDGLGLIVLDGRTLRGGKSSGLADEWWGDGVAGATERYWVRDSKASSTGKQLVISRAGDRANTVTINHFDLAGATTSASGYLGIRLDESQQCFVTQGVGDGTQRTTTFWDSVVHTIHGQTTIGENSAAVFSVAFRNAARFGETVRLQLSALADRFKLVLGDRVVSADGAVIELQEGQTQVTFALQQQGEVSADARALLSASFVRDGEAVSSNVWTIDLQDVGTVQQTLSGDQSYDTVVSQMNIVRDGRIVVAKGGLTYRLGSANNLAPGNDVTLVDNVLYGALGNDRIEALIGNDALDGGDGDDMLDGGSGDDLIVGGAGFNHLIGGIGNDFIAGSAVLSSSVQQLGPNDTWLAPAGKSILGRGPTWGVYVEAPDLAIWHGVVGNVAGAAANVIDAGAGDDYVMAGTGDDRVHGGDGNDRLDGMGGSDTINGGDGDDEIHGDGIVVAGYLNSTPENFHGSDYLNGGNGNDTIHGGGGSDVLLGGEGADIIFGDSGGPTDGIFYVNLSYHGADTIDGGAGNDRLEGGGGDDIIKGGSGSDTLWGDTSASNMVGNTAGDSALALSAIAYGDDDLDGGGGNDFVVGGGGDDAVFGGDGDDALWGDESNTALAGQFHGADHLDGGNGRDVLVGGGGDDTLIGGAGDDQLDGDDAFGLLAGAFHGADYLDGGAGNDLLIGHGGADVLFGGSGNDTLAGDSLQPDEAFAVFDGDDMLDGEDGDDTLLGGGGSDTLDGGNGNDRLDGGAGADIMWGGPGDDVYMVDNRGDLVIEFEGEGVDTVFSSVDIVLPDHIEHLYLTGDAAVTVAGNDRGNTLVGNDAANTIMGGAGRDYLRGGGGADILVGGAGDDRYEVDQADDQVIEQADEGRDQVRTTVSYTLASNLEELTAIGGGHLTLTGNADGNSIFGNAGNNLISGAGGDDFLKGGAGDDIYLFGRGDGYDTIDNFDFVSDAADPSRPAAVDIVQLGAGITAADVLAWRQENDLVVSIRGTMDQLLVIDQFAAPIVQNSVKLDWRIDRFVFDNGQEWGTAAIQLAIEKAELNRAPLLSSIPPRLHARVNDVFVHVLASDLFIDPDPGDTVRYHVSMADGAVLPAWLVFDPSTLTLSGRASAADIGDKQIAVWATDDYGASAWVSTTVTVAPQNRAPVLAEPVPDQVVPYRGNFVFDVPATTFVDPDLNDAYLRQAASLADGSPLPAWLTFDALKRSFSGFADVTAVLDVRITATDSEQLSVTDTFQILVGGPIILGTAAADVMSTSQLGGTIYGLAGDDTLSGSTGNDLFFGGDGNDHLTGARGVSYLDGGGGSDVLIAGEDLYFSSGNTLLGGDGNDTLLVKLMTDDNLLEGGRGDDTLTGSGMRDTYRFNRGDGQDTIVERQISSGYAGDDVLLFGPGIAPGDVVIARSVLPGNLDDLVFTIGNGDDRITVKDWFARTPLFSATEKRIEIVRFSDETIWSSSYMSQQGLTVRGTAGDDTMLGSVDDDVLLGLAGNDTLNGGLGHNILDGGDGDDWLYAASGQHIVTTVYPGGRVVEQTIWGSNILLGGAGNDTLTANRHARDTILEGGPGDDVMRGSRYNDIYRFGLGDGCDTVIEIISSAGFDDMFQFGSGITAYDIAVTSIGDDMVFYHGDGLDSVLVPSWFLGPHFQIEAVAFSDFSSWTVRDIDAMLNVDQVGSSASDTLIGTAGADKLLGMAGDDLLKGMDGHDALHGGPGDDNLDGGNGDDRLHGGNGNDRLMGGNGNDLLVGDAASETAADVALTSLVVVARGAVCQSVWPRMEVWIAGVRLQTFDVASGDFTSYVVNLPAGIKATEVDVAFVNDAYRPELSQDRNLYLDRIIVNGRSIGASGAGAVIDFGTGAAAFDGVNTMSSYGALNSHGALRFSLLGSDLLDGGAGTDTMVGGFGNDRYVVDAIGDTVIELANAGHDIVRASVSHVLSANVEDLELTGTASIDGAGNVMRNTLRGNAAANRLDGGAGADMLVGGAGDDTYVVDNTGDIVYEVANGGTDSVFSSVNLTLRSEVENLTLTGTAATGTGNTMANVITGNNGNNTLSGMAGNDRLLGGGGSDRLFGGDGNDYLLGDVPGSPLVSERIESLVVVARGTICAGFWPTMEVWIAGAMVQSFTVSSAEFLTYTVIAPLGIDAAQVHVLFVNDAVRSDLGQDRNLYVDRIEVNGRVIGAREAGVVLDFGSGTGAFDGYNTASSWGGMSGNSALHFGLQGSDLLDGGSGIDRMEGGIGDDVYRVDHSLDQVVEYAGAGHDIVQSSASFTLGAYVEDLELTGNTAINGTGNAQQNTLRGNAAANRLDGAGGKDLLVGGGGGDTYVMARGHGVDTVYENDATVGTTDIAEFIGDIHADQLWFRRAGTSMEVSVIGTADLLRVSGWYSGSAYHVEQFRTSDGKTLLDSQVQNLVEAMASFAPPPMGQTHLSDAYANQLAPVLAANWQ